MNRQGDGLYTSTVWSLGLFLLASSAVLLIIMLANVIGPFRFTAIAPEQSSRAIGFWIPVEGDAARPYTPELTRRIEAWRQFVDEDDIVIESSRLRELLSAGVGAVVLPDARVLSAEQVLALDRYLDQGGGVIVTGSIGVRSPEQDWLGYDVMRDLLRVASIQPLPREHSDAVAAHRRGPLSAGLGPAERFSVIAEPGVPAVDGEAGELLWAKADFAPGHHAAASRRVRLGAGRLAWVGPGPEAMLASDESDRLALEGALANALAWVRRRPILELEPWPAGAPFAVEIGARAPARRAPPADAERFALEDSLREALEAAAKSGEFLHVEIPSRGEGDEWAAALASRLTEQARVDGAWMTTREDASRWAATRAGILLSVAQAGPSRLLVNVTNRSERVLDGAALRLWINRPAAHIAVDRTTLGQQLPEVRFDRASEAASIGLPEVRAGATITFYVDIAEPDSDGIGAVHPG